MLNKAKDILIVEIGGFLGAVLLYVLNLTLRWQRVGLAAKPGFWDGKNPRIFVVWHNRQLMMPFVYRMMGGRWRTMCALASRHRDGRIIGRSMNYLGFRMAAGSSTRGGRTALRALVRGLNDGRHVAVTPDGPRGPLYRFKSGALKLAQLSGAPLYPVAYAAKRRWEFGSWDRMFLPKPFSQAVLVIGEPIEIPSGIGSVDLKRYLELVELKLNEVTAAADGFEYA